MIKKTILLALSLCLALTILFPAPVQAESGITVVASSVESEFPARMTFRISVRSDVDITDIRLYYAIERESFAQVTSEAYVEFDPATEVDAEWSLEMVLLGGLPTGSVIDYWWEVEDANGQRIETEPASAHFDDTNYEWDSLTEGKLTIYCYQDDEAFLAELMAAAQEALQLLAESTGAELERPAKLYIYANALDMQQSLIVVQEWAGGLAFQRLGIIALGIAPTNISWGKDAIAHELAHLVVHQVTFNPYNNLPTWLDEGLAMYAEGDQEESFGVSLEQAIESDGLISVQSLCSPFSAYSDEANLAYAQSYSLVNYLITEYGQADMLALLNTFQQGSDYDAALEAVYGFDMDGLDSLWREYIDASYDGSSAAAVEQLSPALVIAFSALGTCLLLAVAWLIKRRLGRRSR